MKSATNFLGYHTIINPIFLGTQNRTQKIRVIELGLADSTQNIWVVLNLGNQSFRLYNPTQFFRSTNEVGPHRPT